MSEPSAKPQPDDESTDRKPVVKRRGKYKPRKPSLRQKRLIAGIAAGKTTRQSAIAAGYRRSANHAGELLGARSLRESIRKFLPPLHDVVDRLREGLDSYRVEIASTGGKITDQRKWPDFPSRLKYAELYCKLMGLLAPEEPGDNVQSVTIVVHKNASIEDIRDRGWVGGAGRLGPGTEGGPGTEDDEDSESKLN